MVLGRKEISIVLLAIAALTLYMILLATAAPSEAQQNNTNLTGVTLQTSPNTDLTGATRGTNAAEARAGGATARAQSSRERTRKEHTNDVIRNTIPPRSLPPTGGLPVVLAAGSVLTGAGLLGLGLGIRRRRQR